MTNNSRRPEYNHDRTRRICSFPNGLWQAQEIKGEKGSRERDHWHGPLPPTDKARALQQRGE